jgi:pimeloyl-ACP methyl ester carboxylesterase
MQELTASAAWERGDLEVEAEYHRLHFALAVRRPDLLEEIVGRLRTHFTADTVLTARAIERRLYDETFLDPSWDLLPALRALEIPALVLHGEHDFIPLAAAAHIAGALPYARLVVLEGCGHFPFLEAPELVHEHVAGFLDGG